jgi:hypothetical protein
MVKNIKINKTKNYLSIKTIEHKKNTAYGFGKTGSWLGTGTKMWQSETIEWIRNRSVNRLQLEIVFFRNHTLCL